ncbi:hypothetical protein NPIL_122571 [Nephila pilipes]|uniref:Uncharacterized protein n=1 Tax=Nephila pilipes TaxID=299642 RepID=A0A8X6TUC1_NEPPI|nr:hypothetical protein NPIL_122571 [Nephila pilipes]
MWPLSSTKSHAILQPRLYKQSGGKQTPAYIEEVINIPEVHQYTDLPESVSSRHCGDSRKQQRGETKFPLKMLHPHEQWTLPSATVLEIPFIPPSCRRLLLCTSEASTTLQFHKEP